ncbi:AIM24 family protein [Methanothermobacter sp. THM-2]|uniref:AIM24 family protein n=1 Tax=Methanothermobacter sp. THM-2 TaxID=2606912 RepID=UPI001F5B2794|nr:AIM24 family protein [Methanothermobacter sp. THM-2]
MKYEIIHRPSYSMVNIQLESGEAIKAEAGAMVSMSSNIEIQTETGGLLGAVKRSMLGGKVSSSTPSVPRGGVRYSLHHHTRGMLRSSKPMKQSMLRAVHSWRLQRMWR